MTKPTSTTTMMINERSRALGRAQRAPKAIVEHPHSSMKELGHAREHLNACYSYGSGEHVWNAVDQVEAMAKRRYGVPSTEEHGQLVKAAENREEPATATRGREAEDRAIPWTSSPPVEMQQIATSRARDSLTRSVDRL